MVLVVVVVVEGEVRVKVLLDPDDRRGGKREGAFSRRCLTRFDASAPATLKSPTPFDGVLAKSSPICILGGQF